MENFLLKKNKILIVAAHPDDEILGCGGTISKIKNSSSIKLVFLTNGVDARKKSKKNSNIRIQETLKLIKYLKIEKPSFFNFPDNQLDKVPMLKIIKKIEKEILLFKPNIIFTHSENCLNIDHVTTYNAVVTASRPIQKNKNIQAILSFEVPSSTEWKVSKKKFNPNFYFDIKETISEKIRCLKFYKSEIKKYPHSRSQRGIEIFAKFRGLEAGLNYAEAFEIKRIVL